MGSEKSGPAHKYEVGQKFGRWTLIQRLGYQGGNYSKWRVRCECGFTDDVVASNVTTGKSMGCASCAATERNLKRGRKK
jgi:hypothetical protein